MFGVYFHNLRGHGGLMLRIISGLVANMEKQERFFNTTKRITKRTTNYHLGHIIPNLLILLQGKEELGEEGDNTSNQQQAISSLAAALNAPSNTQISFTMIKKYSRNWQGHLQHIADYLVNGEGVWWRKHQSAVEFHNIDHHPSAKEAKPQLHHFPSSTLIEEERNLKVHAMEEMH